MKTIEFNNVYPFSEGDRYFTIEDRNTIVESVWDDCSEDMYTPDKMYFNSEHEAILYLKLERESMLLAMLQSALEKISQGEDGPIETAESVLTALQIGNETFKIKVSKL